MRREKRREIICSDKEESLSLYFARRKQKRWNRKGPGETRLDIMLPDEEKLLWVNLILEEKKTGVRWDQKTEDETLHVW